MKTLIAAIALIVLSGCLSANEESAAEWIRTARKPVRAYNAGSVYTGVRFTLIDADGRVYSTGVVNMSLPDTITVIEVR